MTMNYTEHSNKSRRFEADLEKRTFYQLYKSLPMLMTTVELPWTMSMNYGL